MARTEDTINTMTMESDESFGTIDLEGSGVSLTIDSTLVTNGLDVTDAFSAKDNSIYILVTNTAGASKNLTLKSGGYANSILGDKVRAIPDASNGRTLIGDIDASRFEQADGGLHLDFEEGFTGEILVFGKKAGLR